MAAAFDGPTPTDQIVSSAVMNARVVTVSGVTWTFFTSSHAFRCGGEEGWDHYRLGHPPAHHQPNLLLYRHGHDQPTPEPLQLQQQGGAWHGVAQ